MMNQSRHMATLASRACLCLLLATLMLAGEVSLAVERVQRRFDSTNGLAVSAVFSLTQDSNGFIWIGTAGGLVRYDGSQMRSWAKETINRDVFSLSAGPAGEVVVAEGNGTLYRVTAAGVEAITGPDGQPFNQTWSAEFDLAGRLWVVTDAGGLNVRDAAGSWKSFNVASAFPGERVRRVRSGADDRVYVLTNKAVWRTHLGENPQKLLEVMRPIDVIEHPNGSLFLLAWQIDGELIEIRRDGSVTLRTKIYARPIDLVLRGKVVWASAANFLVALREGESPEMSKVPSGGPLLVDHEDDLWLGTFSGLIQFPEPETTIWNEKDGLTTAHTRTLAKTEEGVWVGTWGDMSRIAREENQWRVYDEKLQGLPCLDEQGVLLASKTGEGIRQRQGGRFVELTSFPGGDAFPYTCTRASDGTLLSATARGLFRINLDGSAPVLLSTPTSADGQRSGIARVFEDGQRFWAGTLDGRICHGNGAAILAGQAASWSCQSIGPSINLFDFVRFPSGKIWMSTSGAGMWRLRGDKWERMPASQTLPSQIVFNLTSSPAGGVWLVGQGTTMRVVESNNAGGWEVVEELSPWEGLPGSNASDLIEEPDGSLWLATSLGVVRVPPEARRAEAAPPAVRFVDTVLNGQTATAAEVRDLPHSSQVELHFAALSYRDRGRLRYQYRLHPDAPWIDSRDTTPVLRFVNLGAGDYQAEVRASLDGLNWSAAPAQFSFHVLKPWYLQTWALVLFALVAGAILYGAHRGRIAVLMRLERQRTQIARDLHDEMGSGLGSIGILSGIAAQNNLEGIDQQELAKKISETAGELGTTLTEIVWALKPGTSTLEALAYHLAERGGRLFPANEPSFTTQFPPTWPKVELSLAVRRNVLLIASEALHNTARHSHAREVTLGLEPAGGKRWRLWLSDDGRGLNDGNSSNGSGMGLNNMRRRAEEIGAAFSLAANNGRGTSLSLVFDPSADDRRLE